MIFQGIDGNLKDITTVFIAVSFAIALYSQNLVPNAGFEEYLKIPCDPGQEDISSYLSDWDLVADGTPDFFHTRAKKYCYAHPLSTSYTSFGFETPHTGKGMGLITIHGNEDGSYREYIGVKLNEPLKVGHKYSGEFLVSLGDFCGNACNNIGLLFFVQKPEYTGYHIFGSPQINCNDIITQTEGWVTIYGEFVADSAYNFMVVGNFIPVGSTKCITIPKRDSYPGKHEYQDFHASYFIDDFFIKEVMP